MSDAFDLHLDSFARRLAELERELVELRQMSTALSVPEPEAPQVEVVEAPEPVPPVTVARPETIDPELTLRPWLRERLDVARQRAAAGRPVDALKVLETTRRDALAERELGGLVAILQMTESIGTGATGAVRNRADRLAYATAQNVRYVERKGGGVRRDAAVLRSSVASAAAAEPPPPTFAGPPPRANAAARREPLRLPQFRKADLLGAGALAIAGGVVTLLGIVFFFVLAVNRGWIGPVGRVGLGAVVSTLVFASGFELRRRYQDTHASLAAVGVGIAGGFVTLLAAAALYDLISDAAALVVCAAIASVGLATALAWRSQLIAGFGLIGAMLMPVAVVAQSGWSVLGTAFVAVVFAATAIVSLRRRWRELLVAGTAVSLPQIAILAAQAEYHGQAPLRIVLLVAVFAVLYLAAGLAYQITVEGEGLEPISTSLISIAGFLAAASAVRLYDTSTAQGIALLVITVVYALLAAALFSRRATRDLSAYLATISLTIGAIALATLLDGQALTYSWAAEAAALAWLARRVRELRYQVWSAVYLLLTLGHVLVVDVPPTQLSVVNDHPAAGVGTVVALALAMLVFAFYARPWAERFGAGRGLYRLVAPALTVFEGSQEILRSAALWSAGVLGAYAASLLTLSLFSSFDWGHVAVSALWCALGLAVLLVGLRRGSTQLVTGGVIWLAATGVLVVVHGVNNLTSSPRSWSFLILAATFLAAGHAYQLMLRRERAVLDPVSTVLVVISVALAVYAIVVLLRDASGAVDPQGAALLALAGLYGVLTAVVFRRAGQRDYRTLLWAIALAVGAVAAEILLSGTYLVLALAAAGAIVSWLSARTHEQRFQFGAGGLILLALGHAILGQSPPDHLFTVLAHPASGVLSVFVAAAAIAVFAYYLAGDDPLRRNVRLSACWLAGVLTVYGLSLGILDLVQRAFPDQSLHTSFQRGHTAVSAFWGLLGLALLYAGLKRWRVLLLAGFAVLATSLAKIFLYDLPSLSSVTRAVSFLAVGAVLLLGGFFYQRLSASEKPQPPATEGE